MQSAVGNFFNHSSPLGAGIQPFIHSFGQLSIIDHLEVGCGQLEVGNLVIQSYIHTIIVVIVRNSAHRSKEIEANKI